MSDTSKCCKVGPLMYDSLHREWACPKCGTLQPSSLPAPAGLPTLDELDTMNIHKAGGVMDCIRHSEGCSIWRGPGGCSCGAIEAGQVVRRLESLARLAVEAQQDRPSAGGQRGPDTSPEVPALRKHTSDCDLAPYLLGLMDVRCTCGVLDHMPIRREQLREANRAGFSAERQESHPPRPTGGTE